MSVQIAGKKRLEVYGAMFLVQLLSPAGEVQTYTTRDALIVVVTYFSPQPDDSIVFETDHAVIPWKKLRRAADRGWLFRKLYGGPSTLIYDKPHGN
jgi:hypothetical protein